MYIAASESIEIGDDVMIGAYTILRDADHGWERTDIPMRKQARKTGKITIGNDVWIGAHALILKGSRVGDHSIVGANSLVKKDVGEWGMWVGSPVRLLKKRKG